MDELKIILKYLEEKYFIFRFHSPTFHFPWKYCNIYYALRMCRFDVDIPNKHRTLFFNKSVYKIWNLSFSSNEEISRWILHFYGINCRITAVNFQMDRMIKRENKGSIYSHNTVFVLNFCTILMWLIFIYSKVCNYRTRAKTKENCRDIYS